MIHRQQKKAKLEQRADDRSKVRKTERTERAAPKTPKVRARADADPVDAAEESIDETLKSFKASITNRKAEMAREGEVDNKRLVECRVVGFTIKLLCSLLRKAEMMTEGMFPAQMKGEKSEGELRMERWRSPALIFILRFSHVEGSQPHCQEQDPGQAEKCAKCPFQERLRTDYQRSPRQLLCEG